MNDKSILIHSNLTLSDHTCKQECIPVGCTPSAAVAVSARGGGVPGLGGGAARGVVSIMH